MSASEPVPETVRSSLPGGDPDDLAAMPRRRWWALATVALGVSIIIMDATVVNVALPSLGARRPL